ncbi:MAG: SPOR domain-containing protein [Muribaculaceae bacterium]|nr:SPOR domain-containing protein [Muribaculaceae bacterium]
MRRSFIGNVITLVIVALFSVCAVAQDSKVNVTVPSGLTKRSNSGASSSSASSASSGGAARSGNTGARKRTTAGQGSSKEGQQEVKKKKKQLNVNVTQQKKAGTKVGFRVQVLTESTANGKVNAQQRAKAIALKFPQYRAYISFNAPAWRLRLGDFLDQEDGQTALNMLKKAFPQYAKDMVLVKDNINLWKK